MAETIILQEIVFYSKFRYKLIKGQKGVATENITASASCHVSWHIFGVGSMRNAPWCFCIHYQIPCLSAMNQKSSIEEFTL